ncbi:MAG TPA: hypothetical protein VML54_15140 [Candidatus Limnocylindrales bacterium]|nr:hypothetical protein [Candidatus Limnocylindrales bacterium]
MKSAIRLLVVAWLLPMASTAQEVPSQRLTEVLPPEVAAQVLDHIESARQQGLPVNAMANHALEGVAKGRSATEVLASVELLVADMGRAREALQTAQREHGAGEIEAATAAMRMGVDGDDISALASSQPSGRTLAVPLLVVGGLVQRGLPSDDALAAVQSRLAAGLDDAALLGDFPEVGQALTQGLRPDQIGTALASGFAGFQVPVSDLTVPVGQTGPSGRGGGPGGF